MFLHKLYVYLVVVVVVVLYLRKLGWVLVITEVFNLCNLGVCMCFLVSGWRASHIRNLVCIIVFGLHSNL